MFVPSRWVLSYPTLPMTFRFFPSKQTHLTSHPHTVVPATAIHLPFILVCSNVCCGRIRMWQDRAGLGERKEMRWLWKEERRTNIGKQKDFLSSLPLHRISHKMNTFNLQSISYGYLSLSTPKLGRVSRASFVLWVQGKRVSQLE